MNQLESIRGTLVQYWTPANFFWYGVVAYLSVEMMDMYLQYRQHRIYQTQKKIPISLTAYLDEASFEKARIYNLEKSNFGFFMKFVEITQKQIFTFFFLSAKIWQLSTYLTLTYWGVKNEIIATIVFFWIQSSISTLLGLPFSLYSNFVIEERHGFNKYTLKFYLWDQVKKFLVMQPILSLMVGGATYIIIRFEDSFFVYLWLFSTTTAVLMMIIYPSFIAPLFDKYTPLEDGSLRARIQGLAEQLRFPLKNIYVVDGSKRSAHSNAYFYGIFNSKQIVLYDTLFEEGSPYKVNKKTEEEPKKESEEKGTEDAAETKKEENSKSKGCTESEILAIICHELGHWFYSHLVKNLGISLVNMFVIFKIASLFYNDNVVYEAFGFVGENRPHFIGLMIVVETIFLLYFEVFGFFMSLMSRKFEFQADGFAKRLNFRTELIGGLVKLNKDNLSFPVYDWLYSALTHSHPPILERIEALKRIDDKKED